MAIINAIIAIVIGAVSYFMFTILFYGLNKSVLKVFIPVQKFTSKLKRKRVYENALYYLIIFISIICRDIYKLSNIKFGILLGFLIALNSTIFNIGIGKSENM